MSNIIPPLLSDTPPPPPPDVDDHEDDEFGDFTGTSNLSYDSDDNNSPPGTPLKLPIEQFETDEPLAGTIKCNGKDEMGLTPEETPKDYCDKRKSIVDSTYIKPAVDALSDTSESIDMCNSIAINQCNGVPNCNEETIETICDISTTFSQNEDVNNINNSKCKDDLEVFDENRDFSEKTSQEDNDKKSSLDYQHNKVENSIAGLETIQNEKKLELSIKDAQEMRQSERDKNKGHTDGTCFDKILTDVNSGKTTPDLDELAKPKKGLEADACVDFEISFADPTAPLSNSLTSDHKEPEHVTNEEDFDDFGDFNTGLQETKSMNNKINTFFDTETTTAKPVSNDNSDFDNFITISNTDKSGSIDKFADFSSFEQPKSIEEDNDDFGDFATTSNVSSLHNLSPPILQLNEKQALEKSKNILKEMFPELEEQPKDAVIKDLTSGDNIFNQVKNITETHALTFQWQKSASQNLLLRALNIDSRNILYGPGWNPSMPRFAANLSFTPLEPVKSETVLPPVTKNNLDGVAQDTSLPFVAKEADLSEPIESIPSKVALNSPTEPPTISVNELAAPSKTVTDMPSSTVHQDDFDNFISHTADNSNQGSNLMVLRETHISTTKEPPVKSEESDSVSWLEPTIVTPELSRKEHRFVDADEEFEDFQMVVMPEDHGKIGPTTATLTVKPLEMLEPQSAAVEESKKTSLDLDFIDENVKLDSIKQAPTIEEDEFGEFTFSLPNKSAKPLPSVAVQPLTLLEPLKPAVVSSSSQKQSASISWPDPGITEDEISRFEELGNMRVQTKPEPVKNKPEPVKIDQKASNNKTRVPKTSAYTSKQSSFDDDDWSDFVSVKNASPIHKVKSAEKERSSTPDLPLSVLNLGNLQPTKQPIPVITPNGLVQTKLSTNMTLNFPNIVQQTSRMYPQPQVQHNPMSIISNQYANQAFGSFNSYQNSSHTGGTAKTLQKNSMEDDEWSDFVSHQSTKSNHHQHHYHHHQQQQQQFAGYMSAAAPPNIITNPTAGLDIQKQQRVNGSRKVQVVPNVPMPDLDFLAPRNRTAQHRK